MYQKSKVFVKNKKKLWGGSVRGGGGFGLGGGGQGGCERRIEVFVKIPKKIRGSLGVRFGDLGWM